MKFKIGSDKWFCVSYFIANRWDNKQLHSVCHKVMVSCALFLWKAFGDTVCLPDGRFTVWHLSVVLPLPKTSLLYCPRIENTLANISSLLSINKKFQAVIFFEAGSRYALQPGGVGLVYSPGWSQSCNDPPTSASRVLELQDWATMPSSQVDILVKRCQSGMLLSEFLLDGQILVIWNSATNLFGDVFKNVQVQTPGARINDQTHGTRD